MVVSSGLPITLPRNPLPFSRLVKSTVPDACGWMNTSAPSASAAAQNGSNAGSPSSRPATLPPIAAPRSPMVLMPRSSCSAARSGNCSATEANAANRSLCDAQNPASVSFWTLTTCAAVSRSASYQLGLMLRTATSMPWASMTVRRSASVWPSSTSGASPPAVAAGRRNNALAFGTAQCACMSTVLIRRPFTVTRRRTAPDPRGGCAAAASRPQPTKTRPAAVATSPRNLRRWILTSASSQGVSVSVPSSPRRMSARSIRNRGKVLLGRQALMSSLVASSATAAALWPLPMIGDWRIITRQSISTATGRRSSPCLRKRRRSL